MFTAAKARELADEKNSVNSLELELILSQIERSAKEGYYSVLVEFRFDCTPYKLEGKALLIMKYLWKAGFIVYVTWANNGTDKLQIEWV